MPSVTSTAPARRGDGMLRADLHVHSRHSRVSGTLRFLRSRDCYSFPEDVYRTAKARGMDVVTITDHDSIDGCLELLSAHPAADDFVIAEEISCGFPDAQLEVHLAAYGMTESLHEAVQPLRANVFDVAACLRSAGVFFALNHLLHFYRGQVPLDSYLRLLMEVPALEVRNGTMSGSHNALLERIIGLSRGDGGRGQPPLAVVAGSDAHTLRRIGTTWTEAPGHTTNEYLANLRNGLGRAGGMNGSTRVVASDAYGVIASYVASLIGRGPRDHAGTARALYVAFVAMSLPFQFLPFAIAAATKIGERRAVRLALDTLGPALAGSSAERDALQAAEARG